MSQYPVPNGIGLNSGFKARNKNKKIIVSIPCSKWDRVKCRCTRHLFRWQKVVSQYPVPNGIGLNFTLKGKVMEIYKVSIPCSKWDRVKSDMVLNTFSVTIHTSQYPVPNGIGLNMKY